MQIVEFPERSQWSELLKRPIQSLETIETVVRPVLEKVRNEGDKALIDYTLQFDKAKINSINVSESEILEALKLISPELSKSINQAKQNIETFHRSQVNQEPVVETMNGVKCWRKSIGIEKVGIYIPGGTAPLFSTILMLSVPAQIAGCKEIVLCTPPDITGKIHPAILYTAHLCGIKNIFKCGGSQAIAAMAFGTESIPKVYKIFGPGNQYVTVAKQLVNSMGVAIDMPAGPSEVAVIADKTSNPEFVAADLLSQAEHGSDSQVLLVSTDKEILLKTKEAVSKQVAVLPRQTFAQKALDNSKFVLLKNDTELINFINEYAAEHLIIATDNHLEIAAKIVNAGSIFLGHYTPEAAGDYASGTNHTLPTNGYARAYSGVSVDSFVKKVTFQSITKEGIQNIGKTIEIMAEAEQLMAHKNAVSVRLKGV